MLACVVFGNVDGSAEKKISEEEGANLL